MSKQLHLLLAALLLGTLTTAVQAQPNGGGGFGQQGNGFIDLNGDGYNDNAPDADGDGIPNGLDPDYLPPQDCDGDGNGNGNFVDEDGDGFNDNAPDADGDGIPNGQDADYVPAHDGSGGKGFGGMGNGDCDLNGPHGPGFHSLMPNGRAVSTQRTQQNASSN